MQSGRNEDLDLRRAEAGARCVLLPPTRCLSRVVSSATYTCFMCTLYSEDSVGFFEPRKFMVCMVSLLRCVSRIPSFVHLEKSRFDLASIIGACLQVARSGTGGPR